MSTAKKFSPNKTPAEIKKEAGPKEPSGDIVIKIPDANEEVDLSQLEATLLKLSPDHYKAAQLRREGNSYVSIAAQLKITPITAKKWVDMVLSTHYQLYPKQAELMRQDYIDRLEDLRRHLYHNAKAMNQLNENGEVFFNHKQIETMLKIMDKESTMLGIEPPKVVQVELSEEIKSAQEKLRDRLKTFDIIDVTPNGDDDE
jgi:hypothetical protein